MGIEYNTPDTELYYNDVSGRKTQHLMFDLGQERGDGKGRELGTEFRILLMPPLYMYKIKTTKRRCPN